MSKVNIFEVGPRDGFQNLKEFLETDKKLKIIDGLIASGIKQLEISSFVSPKAIPQMKDAKEVATYCVEKYPDVKLYALVPNLYGAKVAWECGIRDISYVISLSETHNKKNINRTHEESIDELKKIMNSYPDMNICIGMATVFGCPFEGLPKIEDAIRFAKRLWENGIREINLADTIGIADPKQVRETISALVEALPECRWQVHIHDTRNMGMVNTLVAIESGITTVQSTLGGLGGCPFAPGASGNTATEDLVYMLERMGYDTGVDFVKLLELSKYQKSFVNGVYSGHHVNIKSDSCNC
ncbi:hydroxymethylglutaryl-CoA lyase [Clostridioides difficile]|uniref:hydroxymethylglutaryl-CoA lyase n=1 Tax=Clostridioides difficile TaxID=1496 RepID=UPI00093B3784|nr:hydroxymethylglutaryl-CoA lyase [Clostridioides difficile]EGT5271564.1 hydroxymethylglutaryl-CoA lyase [Clostridioides difficile]EGT5470160.1 hydroxymethylglutaryl-CoA lyase [Clostridioides difficile]MBH8088810.1 hydroxymethylglutaryl-CoA lyase [Clostridioides difficile]MBY1608019.1 hydroxymethylglutaryl-CoA lyase [Clostridioides difficile]MBY2080096.1 hydroxymethylglutaryl-CoA lyase [Clostridioides difficile]